MDRKPSLTRRCCALGMVRGAALLLVTGLFAPSPQTAEPAVRDLAPDLAVEGTLAGGESHRYRLALLPGLHGRLLVEQQQIDLKVHLLSAAQKPAWTMENLGGPFGTEEVTLLAEDSDPTGVPPIEIEVAPVVPDAKAGSYVISLVEVRPARAADRDQVAAERRFIAGAGELMARSAQRAAACIEHFDAARSAFETAGRLVLEGRCFDAAAFCHWLLDRPETAIPLYRAAQQRFAAAGEEVYLADSKLNMATARHAMGAWEETVDTLEAILPIYQRLDYPEAHAATLSSLMAVTEQLGRPEEALSYSQQAIDLARRGSDRWVEATALRNLGVLQKNLGDFEGALGTFAESAALEQTIGWLDGEAQSLAETGATHLALGDVDQALDHLQRALPLAVESESRRVQVWVLRNLGRALTDAGRYSDALARLEEGRSLIERPNRNDADLLLYMAQVELERGRPQAAAPFAEQALARNRALGYRDGELHALLALAQSERESGALASARERIDSAMALIEAHRDRLVRPDRRTSYAASKALVYELNVALWMDLHRANPETSGFDRQAFEAWEAARARSLREALISGRQGQPDAFATGRQAEALRHQGRRLEALETQRLRLRSRQEPSLEALAVIDREIRRALDRYRDLRAQARAEDPRYAALTEIPHTSVERLQREVLADGTELIEIALGREESFLWHIGSEHFESFRLPPRREIEEQALRLHRLLAESHLRGAGPSVDLASRRLGEQLFGPVLDRLGGERLVLVSDGALAYLPLGQLSVPRRTGEARPLADSHDVIYAPSAGVLAELRRRTGPAQGPESAEPLRLAVMADPVFAPRDERVGHQAAWGAAGEAAPEAGAASPRPIATLADSTLGGGVHAQIPPDLQRSARELSLDRIGRLPFSRREALAIGRLLPAERRLIALDFDANLDTVTGGRLGDFHILHFATHTLVNSHHPELSGLVLSLVDSAGNPRPGFLRAHRIAALDLAADLVVLSGCQTALGKVVRGEGLLGLTRAFMHAGVPRVVVSLWDVSDEATAELMTRFYRALLEDRLSVSAALRHAQLEMSQEPRWQAPYYWAGFILQGG
ncbi:MAG: CHAT domain-containing tetratricopeptide repeat protein [Acidobacteriota bacterium]